MHSYQKSDISFLRNLDNTYLQLLSSLVNTLINRIIKIYKNEQQDVILFKAQLEQIKQSLTNYEQFKTPLIKYSELLTPLMNEIQYDINRINYFNSIIDQEQQKQYEYGTARKGKRKIYSSKQSLDNHKSNKLALVTLSNSTKNNFKPWTLHQKNQLSNTLFPSDSKRYSYNNKRRGISLNTPNYHKQVSKSYDKIINSVINSKGFRKRKYQYKVDSMLKLNQYPEQFIYEE